MRWTASVIVLTTGCWVLAAALEGGSGSLFCQHKPVKVYYYSCINNIVMM